MGRVRKFVVGAKDDVAFGARLETVIGLLRNAHPRSTFIDFREMQAEENEQTGRRSPLSNLLAIQQLLLKKTLDIAVADARKLPLKLKAGIEIAAVPDRSNPFNVLISSEELILDDQPEEARLAVDNSISKGQLLYYRPDLDLVEESSGFNALQGMMESGKINGFVYAAADVEALHRQNEVVEVFTSSICMPPAGQGALTLLIRKDDSGARSALRALHDPSSGSEIRLERMFLEEVTRKGKMPAGVLGSVEGDEFRLEAALVAGDGSLKVSESIRGYRGDEAKVVSGLADLLFHSWEARLKQADDRLT